MWQFLGTVLVVFSLFSPTRAQTGNFEARLAEQLGLCTNKRTVGNDYTYPCSQCNLQFVSLSPGEQPDQLFLMEARSPDNCGSGGCTGTVYRKRGQSYIAITNFFGYFDRAIARSGNATPDIVYVHNESMRHDFTGDGAKDMAVIKVKYRWNAQRQNFEVADILAIEASGRKVDARAYREQLLQEYRQGSPWVY
ncbi:MAG: hypothetical protein H6558_20785 [Lewinellaceae bacterium]|nr:hypothetical protein [Lewinellaceae bacterium]MCB9288770.1 hypothetical protein [Lewinellaceae bacterium]